MERILKAKDETIIIKEGSIVSVLNEEAQYRDDGEDLWEEHEITIDNGELCLGNKCSTPLSFFKDEEIELIK